VVREPHHDISFENLKIGWWQTPTKEKKFMQHGFFSNKGIFHLVYIE